MQIILCQMEKAIDEWLDAKIKEKGIYNDAELARRAGVASSVISNARIRNSIGPELAQKLAKGLEMRQDEVFYELGLMTERPGDVIIKDELLKEIWGRVNGMSEQERIALRVLLERMFPSGDTATERGGAADRRVTRRAKRE